MRRLNPKLVVLIYDKFIVTGFKFTKCIVSGFKFTKCAYDLIY